MATVTSTQSTLPSSFSTSTSAAPTSKADQQKTQFLQLLVAQMKGQNPLDPQVGTQVVSQLAQFSSLEELINIRTDLDGMSKAAGPAATSTAGNTQGSLQTTNNPLDVAIQGKGFLVDKNGQGQFYTRAGNLHLDADGNLVTSSGALVQGYTRNAATGQIDSNLGLTTIKMPSGLDSPVSTSQFEIAMNLDANAADAAQFSTSMQIYDSLGKAHTATLTLQKSISSGATPQTKWLFDITIPNNEAAGVASTNTDKLSLITGTVANG